MKAFPLRNELGRVEIGRGSVDLLSFQWHEEAPTDVLSKAKDDVDFWKMLNDEN
jgi:hypothetical protein